MKNSFFFTFAAVALSTSMASADQSANWSCKGKEVELSSQSTYHGENSPFNQTLYTMKTPSGEKQSFFLNVEEDIGPVGTFVFTGTNTSEGSFQLTMNYPKDESDGTTLRQTSKGLLTYSVGSWKGESEPVNCVLE